MSVSLRSLSLRVINKTMYVNNGNGLRKQICVHMLIHFLSFNKADRRINNNHIFIMLQFLMNTIIQRRVKRSLIKVENTEGQSKMGNPEKMAMSL